MAQTKLELVVSEELKQRLQAVATRLGKTTQQFAEEALNTFIEDYEDGLAAQESIAANESTISLQQMRKELGLDDRDFRYSKKTA